MLHSVAAVVAFTVWALQGRVASIWLWLLGGFYVYVAFACLIILRIQSRRRASASPNDRWRAP
jgi:hypothetical protein